MSGYRDRKISRPHTEWVSSGAGYFTSKFLISEESIKHLSPGVIESLKSITVNSGKPFTIADYGCADGGTSMPLMYACVKELRDLYGNELEIQINYEDRPENDYNSIFYFLQGLLPHSSSYVLDFPNVFVSASGTSFYEQCFPSESVNLGFSCLAIQWLRKKPCNLTKAVLCCFSEVQSERDMFTKQAEKDWEEFLLVRAKELAKGGRLAVILPCHSGGEIESSPSVQVIYKLLYNVWESMEKDKIISKKEVEEMTIPEYFRTHEEMMEPFISDASPVRKAGLNLVSIEYKEFSLPEKAMWQVAGNAKACVRLMTEQTRAWSNSRFQSALGDHHSAKEKSAILDEFFYRLEEQALLSPEEYMTVIKNAFIIIEKS
ncbi:indole-3-acetate O-methyltransferase 1-like [Stylophora pistillata]|uniref:indole-3-acetate O-methyltransferase 1-like n=1 Tax=Stylophora pistillata TaxID=50429 RepID=UPI000C054330|nr:indole-3-acetate O-methyltransferase 1-like [Stylophora pistillata]